MTHSQADLATGVLRWRDPITGARGYLAIDRQIHGIAGGGCRVRPGLTVEEVARLAHTMTDKFTLFDVPIGGGKCGLDYDPAAPDMPDVLARFFEFIRPFLRESYLTGADLGTTEELVLNTLMRAGLKTLADAAIHTWDTPEQVIKAMPQAFSADVGGVSLASLLSGFGTAEAALQAIQGLNLNPGELRASIQGFGNVGGGAARYLAREGVKLVAIADAEGTVVDPAGLDVEALLQTRTRLGAIDRDKLPSGAQALGGDAWLTVDCEVLVPAAISDAVDLAGAEATSANLKIVSEGANMPLSEEAARHLHERGVFVIPDFLANSAFALISGALMLQWIPAEPDAIFELTSERIRSATQAVLDGFKEGEYPRDGAARVAQEKRARMENAPPP